MRSWIKEIVICLFALTGMAGAIFFYYRSVHRVQSVEEIDLYNLIPENVRTVVDCNKTLLFTHLIEEKEVLQEVCSTYLPEIYLSVMKCLSDADRFLYSSHVRGDLLYAKLSPDQIVKLDNQLIRLFPGYPPQPYEKYGIRFVFYADAQHGFWGYYYHNGIWVASYSRKLLEEAALNQLKNDPVGSGWKEMLAMQDKNALLNMVVKTDLINFSFLLPDSTDYCLRKEWFGGEVFLGEENLCFFGILPADLPADSISRVFVDSFSYQMSQWFWPLQFDPEVTLRDEESYFTFCASLAIE